MLGTPIAPVLTDATGSYLIENVSDGSYQLQLKGNGCYETSVEPVVLSADLNLPRQLAEHTDSYGYGCRQLNSEYVAASNVLLQAGEDETVEIPLPFPFVYYGVSYDRVYASVNGLVEFGAEREGGHNTAIPSTSPPNAQRSRSYTSTHAITNTLDAALYQSVRVDPYEYRFDGLPNGTYQLELRFSQLYDQAIATRYFDVIAQEQTLMPAYDIASEVGSFAADEHTFFVEVSDATLNVRFVRREGLPVIAGLRVSHRTDR